MEEEEKRGGGRSGRCFRTRRDWDADHVTLPRAIRRPPSLLFDWIVNSSTRVPFSSFLPETAADLVDRMSSNFYIAILCPAMGHINNLDSISTLVQTSANFKFYYINISTPPRVLEETSVLVESSPVSSPSSSLTSELSEAVCNGSPKDATNRGSVLRVLDPGAANCTSPPEGTVEGVPLWSTWRRLRMKRDVRMDEILGDPRYGQYAWSFKRKIRGSRVDENRNVACFAGYRVDLRVTVEASRSKKSSERDKARLTEIEVRMTWRTFSNARTLEVPCEQFRASIRGVRGAHIK